MTKLIFALIFLYTSSAFSGEIVEGRVVGVQDGDTFTLLIAENQTIRIRLAQIDAPESQQAFGQRSKQSLSELVFKKKVQVKKETVDRFGRIVGTVFVGDLDVNREQVNRGMAWVFLKFLHDKSLIAVEAIARQGKIGLWSDPNPVPPWEYRRPRSQTFAANRPTGTACGPKRYCKQMTSCDEARQYLLCGLSALDKDGDGVPCESLCRM
jgi:endonuclease YncB( thermonuclease family)